ncbi:MAG: hypothetical protein EOP05_13770, partial [Proteobacteria bacterium]
MKLPDFFGKLDGAGKVDSGKLNGVQGKGLSTEGMEATGKTAELLSSMKDGEQVTREEAMNQFMESMQEELGIPPEKILQALSNLDASALQAPPEETVGQFIDGLDLLDGNSERATELYKDLLKTTGDSLINEKVAGLDSSVNFNIASSKEASMEKLKSSIDGLNESFFRKGAGAKGLEEPKKAQAAMESMDAALAKMMMGKDVAANQAAGLNVSVQPLEVEADVDADLISMDSSSDTDIASALASLGSASANPLAAALQAGSEEGDLSFLDDGAEELSLMAGDKEVKSDFAKELAAEDSDLKDLGNDANVSTEVIADADATGTATPIASALAQGVKSSSG